MNSLDAKSANILLNFIEKWAAEVAKKQVEEEENK